MLRDESFLPWCSSGVNSAPIYLEVYGQTMGRWSGCGAFGTRKARWRAGLSVYRSLTSRFSTDVAGHTLIPMPFRGFLVLNVVESPT